MPAPPIRYGGMPVPGRVETGVAFAELITAALTTPNPGTPIVRSSFTFIWLYIPSMRRPSGLPNDLNISDTVPLMFRSFGSPLGLRIDGMYNHMKVKDDRTIGVPGFGVVNAAVISSANATPVSTLPGTGIPPYLIGGAGIYNLKPDIDEGDDPDSDNKFGVNGGIGA